MDEDSIQEQITEHESLIEQIKEKQKTLNELLKHCESLQQHEDVSHLSTVLLNQLTIINNELLHEQMIILTTRLNTLRQYLIQSREANIESLQSDTLDSSEMPEDEIIPTGIEIETQTSEKYDEIKPEPIHTEQQTSFPLQPTAPQVEMLDSSVQTKKTTENITITKSFVDGKEQIQIDSNPNDANPLVEHPDDIVVEAKYQHLLPGESNKGSEFYLKNVPQSFETTFTEPDETTTEVVVDADGTKHIIVRKLTRAHHQILQQHQQITSIESLIGPDNIPITQTVSQINIDNQKAALTLGGGGNSKTTVTQSSKGSHMTALPSGTVELHTFETEPETQEFTTGIPFQRITTEQFGTEPDYTETSSVHAVIQQVTSRVIRRTRKIIKKIVIIDGVEHVTEEIIEEPEEIEITEDRQPTISVNLTRTVDGRIVTEQQYGQSPDVITTTQQTIQEPKEIIEEKSSQVFEIIQAPVELISASAPIVDTVISDQLPERKVVEEEEIKFENISEIWPHTDHVLNNVAIDVTKKENIIEKPVFEKTTPTTTETVTYENIQEIWPENLETGIPFNLEKYQFEIEAKYLEDLNSSPEEKVVIVEEAIIIPEIVEEPKKEIIEPIKTIEEPTIEAVIEKVEEKPKKILIEITSKKDYYTEPAMLFVEQIVEIPEESQTILAVEPEQIPQETKITLEEPIVVEEEKKEPTATTITETVRKTVTETTTKFNEPQQIREKITEVKPVLVTEEHVEEIPKEISIIKPEISQPESIKETISEPEPKEQITEISTIIITETVSVLKEVDVPQKSEPEISKPEPIKETVTEPESKEQITETSTTVITETVSVLKEEPVIAQPEPIKEAITLITETVSSITEDDHPQKLEPEKVQEILTEIFDEPENLDESIFEKEIISQESIEEALREIDEKQKRKEMATIVLKKVTVTEKLNEEIVEIEPTTIQEKTEYIPPYSIDVRTATQFFLENESMQQDYPVKQTVTLSLPATDSSCQGSVTVSMKLEPQETAKVNVNITEHITEADPNEVPTHKSIALSPIVVDDQDDTSSLENEQRKNRKRKKRKEKEITPVISSESSPEISEVVALISSPDGDGAKDQLSLDPSVAESIELDIPDDSYKSEIFDEVITVDYEPDDKTTADDDELKTDKKGKKKRKRKQKVKPQQDGAESFIPISSPDTKSYSELGSDKETVRKEKVNIVSPDESYLSITSPEQDDTVKIIEESMISSSPESPKPIQTELVITTNVLEAKYIEDAEQQTTPREDVVRPVDETVKPVPTQEIRSSQTSPEVKQEVSLQTSPEPTIQQTEQEIQTTMVEFMENEVQTIENERSLPNVASIEVQTDVHEVVETSDNDKIRIAPETTEFGSQTIEITTKTIELQTSPTESPRTPGESPRTLVKNIVENLVADVIDHIPAVTSSDANQQTETVKFTESIVQTSPFDDRDDRDDSSISTSEPYEIHVETTVKIPSEIPNEPPTEIVKTFVIEPKDSKKDKKKSKKDKKNKNKDPLYVDVHVEVDQSHVDPIEATKGFLENEQYQKPIVVVKDSKSKATTVQLSITKTTVYDTYDSQDDPIASVSKMEITPEDEQRDIISTINLQSENQKPKENTINLNKKSTQKTSSVTIEEVLSPTEFIDTPLTPGLDKADQYARSEDVLWNKELFQARQKPRSEDTLEFVTWNLADRTQSVKNVDPSKTGLSQVLHLATLSENVTEEPVERRMSNVHENLHTLETAIERHDTVIIQTTVITIVETISTWLETIEYRVYLNRQQSSDGPTEGRIDEFDNLKEELANIEESVKVLSNSLESDLPSNIDREQMNVVLATLKEQIRAVENVTTTSEHQAKEDLQRWNEYSIAVEKINILISEIQLKFDTIVYEDISIEQKLSLLDELESINKDYIKETVRLSQVHRNLMRDFPGKDIPQDVYTANEISKNLENNVNLERNRLLQLLSLAEEYEQTLKDFEQITLIADSLVDAQIRTNSLEQLQQELQKHRKFFVNLSRCRAILESLEGNLDSETRDKHSVLHQALHTRATNILEKAHERAQKLSLAASRWTVLEKGKFFAFN